MNDYITTEYEGDLLKKMNGTPKTNITGSFYIDTGTTYPYPEVKVTWGTTANPEPEAESECECDECDDEFEDEDVS